MTQKILKQSDVDIFRGLQTEADEYKEKIENRITEIIHFLCEYFNCKYTTWYWPDAPEGGMGQLDIQELHSKNYITFVLEATNLSKMNEYAYSIPYEFLFMTNKEIEEFIEENK